MDNPDGLPSKLFSITLDQPRHPSQPQCVHSRQVVTSHQCFLSNPISVHETRPSPLGITLQGVFQCGVRDLYSRLAAHPQVVSGNTATSNFYFERRPFKEFVASMDRVVPSLQRAPATMVAGDASAGAGHSRLAPPAHQTPGVVRPSCCGFCPTQEPLLALLRCSPPPNLKSRASLDDTDPTE